MKSDDGRVISNFIVQALKNEDITVYGDGSQTRSFCYVDDLVEHKYSAFLYDFSEVNLLAEYIDRLFTSNELAIKLSKNAQGQANKRHDRGKNALTMLKIYNETVFSNK